MTPRLTNTARVGSPPSPFFACASGIEDRVVALRETKGRDEGKCKWTYEECVWMHNNFLDFDARYRSDERFSIQRIANWGMKRFISLQMFRQIRNSMRGNVNSLKETWWILTESDEKFIVKVISRFWKLGTRWVYTDFVYSVNYMLFFCRIELHYVFYWYSPYVRECIRRTPGT